MKVTAENRLPGAKTETVNVDIVCPITGLKVLPVPAFTMVDGKPQIIVQSKTNVELKVTIETGSFVMYQFQNGVDLKHQNKDHSTLIMPKQVIFYFTYNDEGNYDAKIIVSNSLSKEELAFKVAVKDCSSPALTITGSPVESNPTYVIRGEDYSVTGTLAKINCTLNNPVAYSAEFYRIGNNVALDTKQLTVDNLKYTVPKNTYPAGKYKVTFNQNTTGAKGPETASSHAYVDIKESDLVATIESGSSRTIPQKKRDSPSSNTTSFYIVQLDGSSSYDPDNSASTLSYEWQCKGDSLPPKTPAEQANLLCYSPSLIALSETTSKLSINTEKFIADFTYEFSLTVKQGARAASITQRITFISGNPPTVQFE